MNEVPIIASFLWFDNQAEEAADFYLSAFENSKIKAVTRYGEEAAKAAGRPPGSIMTVAFQIEGQDFTALNGGPLFKLSPAISFFVNCDKAEDVDRLWAKLSDGGEVLMELDKYPFSERFGWIQDKFGVSWQLMVPGRKQKIVPCLMFAGEQHGKAEEAINRYVSIFKNSSIIQMERYRAGEGPEGAVVHAKFALSGYEFTAMDPHTNVPMPFTPAVSFVVSCATQEEVDYYWGQLSAGGDEKAQQCGWLKDKYGVSWQVVPKELDAMLADPDPEKSRRVWQAMVQMKKLDIEALKRAYWK